MKSIIFPCYVFVFLTLTYSEDPFSIHGLWSDNMVLQRNAPSVISGQGLYKEKVIVTFQQKKYETTVDENLSWEITLPPFKAGGPFSLSCFSNKTEIMLNNILIGDVFLCGGQSNMKWPLIKALDGENEVADALDTRIRLYMVPTSVANNPVDCVDSIWQVCSPENARHFSAVGYFFARTLRKKIDVPLGIICSSVGGTPIESWLPDSSLLQCTFGKSLLEKDQFLVKNFDSLYNEYKKDSLQYTKRSKNVKTIRPYIFLISLIVKIGDLKKDGPIGNMMIMIG